MYCSRHIWINPTFTHVDRISGIQEYSNPGWSRVLQSDITMYDRCFSFSTIKLNFLCVCLWFRPRLQLRHCHQCTMATGEHGRFCLYCDVPRHSDDLLQLLSGALWCTAFSVFIHLFSCGVGFPSVITTTVTDNMCVFICRWKPCHSSQSDS